MNVVSVYTSIVLLVVVKPDDGRLCYARSYEVVRPECIQKVFEFIVFNKKLHDCILYQFQGVDGMVDEKNAFLCEDIKSE